MTKLDRDDIRLIVYLTILALASILVEVVAAI